ncbi:DUF5665 domain-containing protein [Desulfosporosinus lacus]|uniref:Uncharacterized protein n=1 Tax=Desulfosporosinus lacus DSM 15449 TaxID=1121420 RepID=A0A1M5UKA3_9FIRM|nr:DUF5665 domain-containing protein [Desulfosporosinus lacus]SHH63276.1 hypothetical protein SAMN02746098_00980 [Desulfosporosinus lacus DSM 15449]
MAVPNEEDKLTVKLSANKESSDLVNEQELAGLRHQVVLLAETLEKMRLAEYIGYLNRPGRMLWFNFLVGLIRGLGTALGAGLLAGFAYFLLKRIVVLNLPVIGGFIAELSKYVNQP